MNKIAWTEIKNDLGDIGFYPSAQDFACIHKLDKMGALGYAIEGDLAMAIQKSNKYWASLPGAPYGQPTRTYAQCEAFYKSQGGSVSGTRAAVVSGGVNLARLGAYVQL
jgi:lysozyme